MDKWWKGLIIMQSFIVLFLLLFILSNKTAIWPEKQSFHLISPRVSTGFLHAQSYLLLNYAPLRQEVESYIATANGNISVYVVNLQNGASLSIRANELFIPASMGKVPVAILVLKKVEEGEFTLDTLVEIEDSDRVKYSSNLYNRKEKIFSVRLLLEKMLQESDNTAYRALVRFLEWEDTDILSIYWDFLSEDRTSVENGQQINYITPRAVYNIFLSLYLSTILQPEHSEYILSLLTSSVFNIGKFAGIPPEVKIAHKYSISEKGSEKGDTQEFHDCGILYPNNSKVFYCIMTHSFPTEEATGHVTTIVNRIYQFTIDSEKQLNSFKPTTLQ